MSVVAERILRKRSVEQEGGERKKRVRGEAVAATRIVTTVIPATVTVTLDDSDDDIQVTLSLSASRVTSLARCWRSGWLSGGARTYRENTREVRSAEPALVVDLVESGEDEGGSSVTCDQEGSEEEVEAASLPLEQEKEVASQDSEAITFRERLRKVQELERCSPPLPVPVLTSAPAPAVVPLPTQPPARPPAPVVEGPALQRLLATLLDRQTRHDECLTSSGTVAARPVMYDKNSEARKAVREAAVVWVESHVREEFQQFQGEGGQEEGLGAEVNQVGGEERVRGGQGGNFHFCNKLDCLTAIEGNPW